MLFDPYASLYNDPHLRIDCATHRGSGCLVRGGRIEGVAKDSSHRFAECLHCSGLYHFTPSSRIGGMPRGDDGRNASVVLGTWLGSAVGRETVQTPQPW